MATSLGSTSAPGTSSDSKDGCTHYRRRCRIVAPCCGEVCWCRHCHKETSQHELDRKAIKQVVCSKCQTQQPSAPSCSSCNVVFGAYYCAICNFWDDDGEKKRIFHCDECDICRIGGRENYFHCPTCDCCYPVELKNNHRCVSGALRQNCPVCMHDLFRSTTQVTILQCGHTIHQQCLADMQRNFTGLVNIRCPICNLSMFDCSDVWERLDQEVAATPMPRPLENVMVKIICCDCQKHSEVLFHVIGHKCSSCNSYNTRRA